MDIARRLQELREQGIELWEEAGQLRFRAPGGRLTEALKEQIRAEKAELLAYLSHANRERSPLRALPQNPAGYRASFAQQRLWFIYQLDPSNCMYNMPTAFEIEGPIETAHFREALGDLIARHEPLRTTFLNREGEAYQIVHETMEPQFEERDFQDAVAHAGQEARFQQLVFEEAAHRFDLEKGPLVRVVLCRCAPDRTLLLLNLHHIVSDGWSVRLICDELEQLYLARVSARIAALEPLPIQYRDFAAWQRSQLQGPLLKQQLDYWRRQLADAPPVLSLPTDRPRPSRPSFRGAISRFQLDPHQTHALHALSRQEGATLFMTLLSAFSALVSRYAQTDDLVIGTPIANRNRVEIERLVGFFVNTLALRLDLKQNPSFRELLARVKKTTLEAYAHQDLPFERLVEEFQPDRESQIAPICQIIFVFHNIPTRHQPERALRIKPFFVETGTAKLDLWFSLNESDKGLEGIVEYNRELFDAATIAQFTRDFCLYCAALCETPGQGVQQVPLVPLANGRLAPPPLSIGRQAEVPHQKATSYFEALAERQPERIAVEDGKSRLTYAELNQRANLLAHQLRAEGIGQGAVVGIGMANCADRVVSVLAVLKAGACFVPLDPDYPSERLQYMMAHAKIRALLTHTSLFMSGQLSVDMSQTLTICLDLNAEWERKDRLHNLNLPLLGEDLAYLIYTSGSTGRPKGVALTHQGLNNLMHDFIEDLVIGNESRLAHFAPFSFDATVAEIFPTLAAGATLVIQPPSARIPGPAMSQWLRAQRITHLTLPPSALALLNRDPLPELKTLLVASETCPPAVAQYWSEGRRMINAYGPTEFTVCASKGPIMQEAQHLVPIGRPNLNARVYVLDALLQPTPLGVPGELYLAGVQLAQGYWRDPALTAERFLPDPFAPGERMYASGDRARFRRDGQIEFLGRIDQQLKRSGFRIEPGEIEAVAAEHPDISQAAVVFHQLPNGENCLACYLLPEKHKLLEDDSHSAADEQLQQWERVFEDSYLIPPRGGDPTFNIAGWGSVLSGEAIPSEEMASWVEETVARILALKPRQLLEIGCGTGLLLFRVAPACVHYQATDLSQHALEQVRANLDRLEPGRVSLLHKPAHELGELRGRSFDTLVLNSIIQYFPSGAYLEQVLGECLPLLGQGARLFLGDLRLLSWARPFYALKAWSEGRQGFDRAMLDTYLTRALAREEEFLPELAFFTELATQIPRLSAAKLLLKRGTHNNELVSFRADLVLELDQRPASDPAFVQPWRAKSFEESELLALWQRWLSERGTASGPLILSDVPNARLASWVALCEQLRASRGEAQMRDMLQRAQQRASNALDPELFWRFGEQHGLQVELRYPRSRRADAFDVFINDRELAADSLHEPGQQAHAGETCNHPLHAKVAGPLKRSLTRYLKERLPEYMQPQHIEVLPEFPIAPGGKVDRARLPLPLQLEAQSELSEPPLSACEREVAETWCELLGHESLGRNANFFEWGGHSLLAVKLVSRLNRRFGLELSLGQIFDHATPASQASLIEEMRAKGGCENEFAAHAIQAEPQAAPRDQAHKLSFAQERLWFLHRLEGPDALYHMPLALRWQGQLDVPSMRRALESLTARHESLRTIFEVGADDLPVQVVLEDWKPRLEEVAHAAGSPNPEALAAQAALPLELDEPPWRCTLFHCGPNEAVLLLTLHHILGDGLSLRILLKELATLYEHYHCGRPLDLPELKLQYRDYAHWQRARFAGAESEALSRFWQEQLADAPRRLALPVDRPWPAMEGHKGELLRFELPHELTQELRLLAKEHQTTLFLTILGGFALLLSRFGAQDEVLIGTPVANRNREAWEPLIGLFLNSLPLRVRLKGHRSTAELLAHVQQVGTQAFAHGELPFERMIQLLDVERDPSRSPLFQVLFAMQEAPLSSIQLDNSRLDPLALPSHSSKFALSLYIHEHAKHLECAFEYNSDLFDPATILGLSAALRCCLEGLRADADIAPVARQILPAAQRATLERALVNPETAPELLGVAVAFERAAAKHGPRIALHFRDRSTTYAELDRAARRLAAQLSEQGAGPCKVVGLACEPGLAQIIGLLAIQKTGAAWLPLDPSLPASRLAFQLEDAQPLLLLCDQAAPLEALQTGSDTLTRLVLGPAALEALLEPASLAPERDAFPACRAPQNAPAYLIYTSGSTGRPKGVLVPQAALSNFLAAMAREPGIAADDRLLSLTTLAFDISILEIMLPLLHGSELILADAEVRRDPYLLRELLATRKATMMQATPSSWQMLLDAGWQAPPAFRILCGGDALPHELSHKLSQATGHFYQMYGPTETTIWSAVRRVAREEARRSGLGASERIGGPILATQLHFLDSEARPLPPGARGELLIGGAGLALGYHNRPDLTAERFLPDPFSKRPGSRLYCTGDALRLCADGSLEFLERLDFQVKIRGFRVELEEVEAALQRLPQVRRALVLALPDASGQLALSAFVQAEQPLDPNALAIASGKILPAYMVPSKWQLLESFPLTHNGKIDRKALEAFAHKPQSGVEAPTASVESQPIWHSETERKLAKLWSALLEQVVEQRESHFFQLGGHSLLAVRLVAQLAREEGVALPIKTLFLKPRLAEMAEAIEECRGASEFENDPELRQSQELASEALPAVGAYPATLAQREMWAALMLSQRADSFNMPLAWWVDDPPAPEVWQAALSTLIDRHESLRTHFQRGESGPLPFVNPPGARFDMDFHDFRNQTDPEGAALALAAELATTAFDLERPFLLRASLARIGERRSCFALCLHHLIADELSSGILLEELRELLAGKDLQGALAPSFGLYAAKEKALLTDQGPAMDFWRSRLASMDFEPLLRPDPPANPPNPWSGGRIELRLSSEIGTRLSERQLELGCSAYVLYLGALQTLLAGHAQRERFTIGSPFANRKEQDLGLVGLLINTLPVPAEIRADQAFEALLGELQADVLSLLEHQAVPAAWLRKRIRSHAKPGAPWFDVGFTWHDGSQIRRARERWPHFEALSVHYPIAKTPLWVHGWEVEQQTLFQFEYRADLFRPQVIAALADRFVVLLTRIGEDPRQPLRSLLELGAERAPKRRRLALDLSL